MGNFVIKLSFNILSPNIPDVNMKNDIFRLKQQLFPSLGSGQALEHGQTFIHLINLQVKHILLNVKKN